MAAKLYYVSFDGIVSIVEAESFGHAIKKWHCYNVSYNDLDPGTEPDSVTLIDCEEFIR